MEAEIEFLLENKMETEIEFFTLSRATKNWEIIAEDQIALFNKQWSLAGDCEKTMLKLRDSKEKAIELKEKAGNLEEEDMEAELEVLLEKKIQTEIEVLILSSTTESCKILAEDHVALIKNQWSLILICEFKILFCSD
ncbi:hypothetical protein AXF42_Ash011886 [Apostasia shenzhenica]|uniref:Uncharacterized protein n=1 Tax=Apostasia shenzhenica TaxID=1088818 RepID=A0A2I0AW39_9ASPA|nr:hypothetical protein AXF42_Ash011886 [Apostasia shenzhenica]